MKMLLNLTRSQQMALTDLIMEHIRCPDRSEQFINCSETPSVVTTPAELLELVQSATPAALPAMCAMKLCGGWESHPIHHNKAMSNYHPFLASTARTDGWVSVKDGLPKTTGVYGIYPPEQIDKDQGLNFSPRYFFANEDRNTYVGNKLAYGWVKDKNHKVTHWRELPAAPGSVPQAEPQK